ncbi:MAG: FecR domain-containing protein [Candidatus Pedobacter colombiensis]|uniref:FecR domain-containing protein n=1 Tax=Candidatus Pedobacter colombiensis TaxID=3121371 RepID=A0AAJ5W7A6_9SPHI|nr:FecR domain-containing protein [Pedobacter sp.]WEK18905.1 MAG: FecR domain-containing protein [Pedobacter sp.]
METQNNFKHTSELIIKFLNNELSGKEKKEFELWLNASAENNALVESFRNTAHIQQEINYLDAVDINKGWEDVSKQIGLMPVKKLVWAKILRYSAAAILMISIGIYTYSTKIKSTGNNGIAAVQDIMPGSKKATLELADGSVINLNDTSLRLAAEDGHAAIGAKDGVLAFSATRKRNNSNGYNLLKTPRAGEYKMILPDGTNVWLNASSSLRFPGNFNKNERRVELTGEAYFEVAHNKALPFIVSFNKTEVEVLGTHFNISSYEAFSKTTLLEGAIKISEGTNKRLIKPGEQAFTYDGHLTVHPADTYKSIAWKEGVFYFKEDRIKDILDQVSRWYDVDIVYNGEPNRKRYSGTIRRQATLSQVLEMLKTVSRAEYSLSDKTVTVNFKD